MPEGNPNMPIIDPATFNELKQMSGEDFIDELIDTFLEDAPKMIAEIKSALASNDVETFRRAAHSMKSNAATFGANELASLAKELEMLGKENKLNETGDRLKSLEDAYASVREELKGLKSA
jgi:HPt (histidine-containing phosphotransfer) domain-containing protein